MIEALAAIAKFVLYSGVFVSAGAAMAAASLGRHLGDVKRRATPMIRIGAAIVIVASAASGVILAARLGGAFDLTILSIVAETPPGLAIALQIGGAALLFVTASFGGIPALLPMAGSIAMLASFAVSGHSASVDVVSAVIAFLHVSAAAWWLGALLLLSAAGSALSGASMADLVRAFGKMALAVVANLVVAGVLLVLTLVDFSQLWLTSYVQALSAKLALAALVLALAAFNKFRLTPQLAAEDGRAARALRRSIYFEATLIFGILAVTAFLTTYTSPHG